MKAGESAADVRRIDLLDVAKHHIDWSLRLFLDNQAYEQSIILSSAANGILENRTITTKPALYEMQERLALRVQTEFSVELSKADIKLNALANLLKHGNLEDQQGFQYIQKDLSSEVVYYAPSESVAYSSLVRSLINYQRVTGLNLLEDHQFLVYKTNFLNLGEQFTAE